MNFATQHEQRVQHFKGLYKCVTDDLALYANELPDVDRSWLIAVISTFHQRFEQWPQQEEDYLRELYSSTRPFTGVTLAAQAFLHIAYDLSISLAEHMPTPLHEEDAVYNNMSSRFYKIINGPWPKPWMLRIALCLCRSGILCRLRVWRLEAWFFAARIAHLTEEHRRESVALRRRDMRETLQRALTKLLPWQSAFSLGSGPWWQGSAFVSVALLVVASPLKVPELVATIQDAPWMLLAKFLIFMVSTRLLVVPLAALRMCFGLPAFLDDISLSLASRETTGAPRGPSGTKAPT